MKELVLEVWKEGLVSLKILSFLCFQISHTTIVKTFMKKSCWQSIFSLWYQRNKKIKGRDPPLAFSLREAIALEPGWPVAAASDWAASQPTRESLAYQRNIDHGSNVYQGSSSIPHWRGIERVGGGRYTPLCWDCIGHNYSHPLLSCCSYF
jgi:hypothetical protein